MTTTTTRPPAATHHTDASTFPMADVRALLAAELASRRVVHPNAAYTPDGKLRCTLCDITINPHAVWHAHLHSTGHTLRISRQWETGIFRGLATAPAGKKRKAFDSSSQSPDERKRPRPDDDAEAQANAENEEEAEKLAGLAAIARGKNAPPPMLSSRSRPNYQAQLSESQQSQSLEPAQSQSLETAQSQLLGRQFYGSYSGGGQPQQQLPKREIPFHKVEGGKYLEESEIEAFVRELAELERRFPVYALNAQATITAAPMTAEDIAAKAREEQSAQRGKRDVEIEAEREEAASALQDEFQEMEGLEDRLRILREKREALRATAGGNLNEGAVAVDDPADEQGTEERARAGEGEGEDDDDDDDDDDDEGDADDDDDENDNENDGEYDGWGFGAR
ncbi:hypothetical protein LTR59_007818 [Friedmanniomyces endolithicus]|nr:hypothetical protein LTR94_007170 [Friedmanniomyces endolithicus]KAK0794399.1 hypothetical protein LTR59_007818 [Friedmanniomyces endolithicus]KAK0807285.1 hypothetical protein LTR75_006669 [Friedmanniomyces endolithicus]KAK0845610.1 hypothetical protein LTR03_007358 [Friedmanniomyces endolithicus]